MRASSANTSKSKPSSSKAPAAQAKSRVTAVAKQPPVARAPSAPQVSVPRGRVSQRVTAPTKRAPAAPLRNRVQPRDRLLPGPAPVQDTRMTARELGPQSGYWQTLVDPEFVHGCKIPDVTFTESGTMTTTQRFDLTQGGTSGSATGYCTGFYLGGSSGTTVGGGVRTWFIPTADTWNGGNSGSTPWVCGATCGNVAITGAPFSVAGTAAGVSPLIFPSADTIDSLASKVRLVSMSVEVTCGAAPLNQSGFYTCGVLPAQTHNSNNLWANETNYTLKNQYQSQIFPIADGGIRLRYTPSDNDGLDYCDWGAIHDSASFDTATRDVGEMFVLMDGAAFGATFQVTIIRNWEYIPNSNSVMMGISPSLVDYEAIEYAFNHFDNVVAVDLLGKPSNVENALEASARVATSSVERYKKPLEYDDTGKITRECMERMPFSEPVFVHKSPVSRVSGFANAKGSKRRATANLIARPDMNSSLMEKTGNAVVALATKLAPSLLASLL